MIKDFFKKIFNEAEDKNDETPVSPHSISVYESDLFVLMNLYSKEVKELLTEKGFSLSPDDMPEKIALLHTEVSEIADAFKKGKGCDFEGEEIADTFIRLMNIPCIYPEINTAAKNREFNFKTLRFNQLNKDSCEKDIKYTIICSLHACIADLGNVLEAYGRLNEISVSMKTKKKLGVKNDDDLTNTVLYVIIDLIYTILAMLHFYTTLINKNLQELVNSKMSKNWQRPYRFNTNPELFK